MATGDRSPEMISKLSKVISQQRQSFLLKVDDVDLQRQLEVEIIKLRRGMEEFSVIAEGGLDAIDAKVRDLSAEDSPTSRLFDAAFQHSLGSVRASSEGAWARIATRLAEVERIATMPDVSEQREAYADYSAELKRKEVEGYLVMAEMGVADGHVLAQGDMESIIKSEYLDGLLVVELEGLARKLGRNDLSEVQTGIDMMVSRGKALRSREEAQKKAKVKELQTVLKGVIAKQENP